MGTHNRSKQVMPKKERQCALEMISVVGGKTEGRGWY